MAEQAEAPAPPTKRKDRSTKSPQETVREFWQKFTTQHPGKVFTILPNNPHARKKAKESSINHSNGQRAAKSYEQAHAECVKDVGRIIKECRRTNQKYRDPHFDIEEDLKSCIMNCLFGLEDDKRNSLQPKGVKRVKDIFEDPKFFINGPTAGDVRQGRDGDCFLMAALCGLGNMDGLIDRVCVARDEAVGVYGFVFHRDGEWQHTIIDDKLYLSAPDYDEAQTERAVWDNISRADTEEEYRKAHQTGSRALYFASCSDENETWLPLLEKAYAKAHGDFAALDGGYTGEAIEDLTGGVTVEVYSTDILDREAFWQNELMEVGKTFLFSCATGFYSNWLDVTGEQGDRDRQGVLERHAYSIMEAKEIHRPGEDKPRRLLKIRNPWGKQEWDGKWSDGSAEWDAWWMEKLNHRFGNDGMFYMSYDDLLRKFQCFGRTRIFGAEWNVKQCWTSVDVPWSTEYHSTKFQLTLTEKAPVVIVLSQLDEKYFVGLEGPYTFDLQFRVEDANKSDPDDYIVRNNVACTSQRSVSTDIELEAGTYWVLMKITASRNGSWPIQDLVPGYAQNKREKFIQIAQSYDIAHARGIYVETHEEKKERKRKEKELQAEEKERFKRKMKRRAERRYHKDKLRHDRAKKQRQRVGEGNDLAPQDDDATVDDGNRSGPRSSSLAVNESATPCENGVPSGWTNVPPLPDRSINRAQLPSVDQSKTTNGTSNLTGNLKLPTTTEDAGDIAQDTQPPSVSISDNSVALDPTNAAIQAPIISGPDQLRTDLIPPPDNPVGDGTALNDIEVTPEHPNEHIEADTKSTDSFPEFDWNSELDMPSSFDESSSSSDNDDTDDASSTSSSSTTSILYRPPLPPFQTKPLPTAAYNLPPPATATGDGTGTGSGNVDDNAPDEEWNAVCTVGLRVYSAVAQEKLSVRVVWPQQQEGEKRKTKKRKNRKEKEKATMEENGLEKMDDEDGVLVDGVGVGVGIGPGTGTGLDPDDPSKSLVSSVVLERRVKEVDELDNGDGDGQGVESEMV